MKRVGGINRRQFLALGASGAGVAAAAALAGPSCREEPRALGYGRLVEDPDGIFDLPPGFSYRVVDRIGDAMDDGYRVPGRPDGMAAFAGANGTVVLMRNHEIDTGDDIGGALSPGQSPPPQAYDAEARGGVTRVVLDAESFERRSSNLVLTGTIRNCAGGPSPWGWLSCEETVEAGHGYVFACPIEASTVQAPQRIDAYGRFRHEAVCVDPSTNAAYLTEDRPDSCLYRAWPSDPNLPFAAKLQALAVRGQSRFPTTDMRRGQQVEVEWVDIADATPDDDSVRARAQADGAAVIVRGEGIWFADGAVYVCSTAGGPEDAGQIFRLIDDGDAATLELLIESTDTDVLDMPDNITVSPWGQLFMAEDGGGYQYLRGLDENGDVFDFGRNALSRGELAGVCFSPDGRAMFVNLWKDGLTLVITGPFPRS